MSADSLWELGLIETSPRRVGLPINGPSWSWGWISLAFLNSLDNFFIGALPMALGISILAHLITGGGQCQTISPWDLAEFLLWSTNSSIVEELWLVHKFVASHGVHWLCWHFVVSYLHIDVRVLIVHTSESLVISEHFITIWLDGGHVFIVLSWESVLTWLKVAVWLVSVIKWAKKF